MVVVVKIVEVSVLDFSVVVGTELVDLLVVVTVPLPCGVVVMPLLLEVLDEEDVGLVVVTLPLLDDVVEVLMLLDVTEDEEVGFEDVLLEPVLLIEVDVLLVLKLVELEEEL